MSKHTNKIAILGSGGWFGPACVEALVKAGVSPRIICRPGHKNDFVGTERFEADWDDDAALIKAFEGIDIVL